MRNSILCSLLALTLSFTAQTEAGRILVGGGVGFDSNTRDQLDTTGKVLNTQKDGGFAVDIRAGYFVADNLALGLLVGISSDRTSRESFGTPPSKSSDVDNSNSTSFGLFGRYYTTPVERRLAFFGQLDFLYTMSKRESEDTFVNSAGVSTSTKTRGEGNGMGLYLSPGVAFFFSDLVALEATFGQIGYTTGRDKSFNTSDRLTSDVKSSSLALNVSASTLRLGLTFFFGGSGGGERK